ncbi:hypothetical protein FRX31_017835 [Thalictrum thalictroides]|uniref:Uncharacterized protein n=1 Tax=Thalictrum thalictroides TaxID=46969 RepID=A0A7J6W5C6_THATH|nr:hypothetical protein FRX31_017835 [Thalictrum thalictroides]
MVENLNLVDYPLHGAKFTWTNGGSLNQIDRFLATADWDNVFPQAKELAIARKVSDHRVVILDCTKFRKRSIPFRFEVMWFENSELLTLIENWWSSFHFTGSASYIWWNKIKSLKYKLRTWNQKVFGRVDQLIQAKTEEINFIDLEEENRQLSDEEEVTDEEEITKHVVDFFQRIFFVNQPLTI